jgi:putative ABC transport system permease protein
LLSDLRYSIRALLKSPRFSIIAIAALAIGIGANTAMFSVVYNVLLRPLPYPQPDRLVFLQETSLRRGGTDPTAPATYFDWREQQHSFSSIAAAEAWGASITGSGRPEEVDALHVSPELLTVLQASPLLGRGFAPDDLQNEAGRVVLLSYALWQRRFGGDPAAIDRSITVNGASYRVVGVMPPDFHFPPFWQEKAELWAPLDFLPERLTSRDARSLRVFARLKDGVSLERASAEMSTIARHLEAAYPATNADRGAVVIPLAEVVVGKTRTALLVLLGAVMFLLLIACANVANLLLARASGRQKEIALRLALGAGRWRLVRQFLAESLLLSTVAGVLGVLLSWWAIHALAVSIPEASRFTLPRYREIGIGGVVLLFTLGISAATSILFGLAPALQFSRPDLHATLKEGGRGNSRQSRTVLRKLLVAGEVAISLMLLSGAGLMVRSLSRLGAVDPGFDPRHVLSMRVVLTGAPYAEPERRNAFYRQALDRLAAVPGVQSAGGINHLPLAGDLWTFSFTVEGRPAPAQSDIPGAAFRVIFPGYFRAMRIPLLRGREFTYRDDAAAPRVIAINQSMAHRYWPGEDALGKRIHLGRFDAKSPWLTVAAVVKDAEQGDWGAPAGNEFYFPFAQNPDDFQHYLTLVIRTEGDPLALANAVQQQIWSLNRDLPIPDVLSMEQVVGRAVWQPRFSTSILTGFALLALVLAAVGIYGVISYSVSQRRGEIGIRMALGARPADVLRSVLGEAAVLAGTGAVAGLGAALLLTRYLKSLLYEVSATDPAVLLTAAGILTAIALAAAWLPAHRATQIDPIEALRQE